MAKQNSAFQSGRCQDFKRGVAHLRRVSCVPAQWRHEMHAARRQQAAAPAARCGQQQLLQRRDSEQQEGRKRTRQAEETTITHPACGCQLCMTATGSTTGAARPTPAGCPYCLVLRPPHPKRRPFATRGRWRQQSAGAPCVSPCTPRSGEAVSFLCRARALFCRGAPPPQKHVVCAYAMCAITL